MARKRSIDPDSWTDEKLADLSVGAHLLWIGLVSHADDEGRIEWNGRQFKTRLFPMKPDATPDAIARWMQENVEHESVVVYEAAGKQYAYHPQWRKHQYVNKPTPSKLPPPPTGGPLFDAPRGTGTGMETTGILPEKDQTTTRILPEYSLKRIGEVWECPVPLVSDSGSVSDSEVDAPAGAGEPRKGEPCLCEVAKLKRTSSYTPEYLAPLFLAVFANQRSERSRRASMATWTGWLREMCSRYSWDSIWAAFAQAHLDQKHGPLRGSSAMWSNLRASAPAQFPQPKRGPGLKLITAEDLV